jgi:hypothetical protein
VGGIEPDPGTDDAELTTLPLPASRRKTPGTDGAAR